MLFLSIIGTMLALIFTLHMLCDEGKRLFITINDARALANLSAPLRRLAWRRWIWPAHPMLSVTSILIWSAILFSLTCRLSRLIMVLA